MQTIRKARLFVIVNLVILFFLIIAFGREYVGNIQIEHEIAQLQEEKDLLEQDQLDTLALIEQLSSEYYLESEARTKQGLGREGETVFIIQDDDDPAIGALAVEEPEVSYSNPQRWFLYFFDPTTFAQLTEVES